MGLHDSQRFDSEARRGSSRCGIVTLLKLRKKLLGVLTNTFLNGKGRTL